MRTETTLNVAPHTNATNLEREIRVALESGGEQYPIYPSYEKFDTVFLEFHEYF